MSAAVDPGFAALLPRAPEARKTLAYARVASPSAKGASGRTSPARECWERNRPSNARPNLPLAHSFSGGERHPRVLRASVPLW